MAEYQIRYSDLAADRLNKLQSLTRGMGIVGDEAELFLESPDTPLGRAVVPFVGPRTGADVRRLWQVGAQGQANTWTDVGAVARDASGMVLSPRPNGSPGTDVVSTGYILPYELADGGLVVIESCGTYKLGSILPRILARLKVGGSYVAPNYEAHMNATGDVATPTDVAGFAANAFEWSSVTLGLNALGGYEALNMSAANLTRGEFHWRLTMRVHALGRYAKWSRGDDDSALRDRNCWVEATLEWGAIQNNAGGRIGEPFAYYNPQGQRTLQYNAFVRRNTATPAGGTVRGSIYSFMGSQWLCHAASDTSALVVGSPNTLDESVWSQMLAEEAPGIGAHWKEFWVPSVSKATISGFASVDWTAGNEVQLELGGPQQVDLGTTFSAYGATTSYIAEFGTCSDGGANYVAKTTLYAATFPRMVSGSAVALFTAAPSDPNGPRCWRALPTTLRDEMRMQELHGYVFGRRNGVAQRRNG